MVCVSFPVELLGHAQPGVGDRTEPENAMHNRRAVTLCYARPIYEEKMNPQDLLITLFISTAVRKIKLTEAINRIAVI